MSAVRSLSGDERTQRGHGKIDVNDPKATSAAPCDIQKARGSDHAACKAPTRGICLGQAWLRCRRMRSSTSRAGRNRSRLPSRANIQNSMRSTWTSTPIPIKRVRNERGRQLRRPQVAERTLVSDETGIICCHLGNFGCRHDFPRDFESSATY